MSTPTEASDSPTPQATPRGWTLWVHLAATLAVACWLAMRIIASGPAGDPAPFSPIAVGWRPPLWLAAWLGGGALSMAPVAWRGAIGCFVPLVVMLFLPRYGPELFRALELGTPWWLALLSVTGLVAWRGRSSPRPHPHTPHVAGWRIWQGLFIGLLAWVGVTSLCGYLGDIAWPPPLTRHPLAFLAAAALVLLAGNTMHDPRQWACLGLALSLTVQARALLFSNHIYLEGDLAALIAMLLPMAVLAATELPSLALRGLATTSAAHLMWILFQTQNRGGGLGLAAAVCVLLPLSRYRWRLLGVGIPTAVLGLAVFSATPYGERYRDVWQHGEAYNTVAARWQVWQAGARLAADHRWLGVGIGNFAHAVGEYNSSDTVAGFVAHNNLLSMLAETGLPGLALWCSVWGLGVWLLLRLWWTGSPVRGRAAACLLASLAAYFVAGLFISRHDMPLAYLLMAAGVAMQGGTAAGHRFRAPATRPPWTERPATA